MVVPLKWYPSCLTPPRSPLKEDIHNKYPLYEVELYGVDCEGYHFKGTTIFPMNCAQRSGAMVHILCSALVD